MQTLLDIWTSLRQLKYFHKLLPVHCMCQNQRGCFKRYRWELQKLVYGSISGKKESLPTDQETGLGDVIMKETNAAV